MVRRRVTTGSMVGSLAAAFLLGALIVLAPAHLTAHEPVTDAASAAPRAPLDFRDELATLEALQNALSEVGDRSTYVWHSVNGRIGGSVELTTSFRDRRGLVCRHLIVTLTAGDTTRRAEGIACRGHNGVWSLDG